MRLTKYILMIMIAGLLIVSVNSCRKNCKKESPRARVFNNGTKDVSVQIKTSGGNTENINNISPGTSSEYRSYAPGLVTYTISIDQNNFVHSVEMIECFEYNIAIDSNNNVTSLPTDRND